MMWLWLSAAMMAITAVIHSVAGEKRLIGPLLARPGSIPNAQGRKVMRGAWHLTSLFMLSNALVMLWPGTPAQLQQVIGGFWLATGLYSLISTRGKHVGWPSLSIAGAAAIAGASL